MKESAKSKYNLPSRLIAGALVVLHLATFGPVKEVLAFSAESVNYKLKSATLSDGGKAQPAASSPTKLLLHFDGANGSTDFLDEAGHNATAAGNAQITSSQNKFGSGSLVLDGSSDYLTLADSDEWVFGSEDFTIDFWANFNALPATGSRANFFGQGSSVCSYWCIRNTGSGYNFIFSYDKTPSGGITLEGSFPYSDLSCGTWHHFAVVRNGSNFYVFLDGILRGSLIDSGTLANCDGGVRIGIGYVGTTEYFNGYLDELRISKGIARWTANFTPPQAAYTLDAIENPNSLNLKQSSLAEACAGRTESANFTLESGYVPILQTDPALLKQNIPYQTWLKGATKTDAFDLDDYFTSPDGLSLSYTASGNSNIGVIIDPASNKVSFSQNSTWSGSEKVTFMATDTDANQTRSNEVSLIVKDPNSPNAPVIVETSLLPSAILAGTLATLKVKAFDPDNDALSFSYAAPFSEARKYKEGELWVSEATWQVPQGTLGHYNILVTVTDTTGLKSNNTQLVNVGSQNHAPVLAALSDITVNEGELALINPQATDADNDPLFFYYSAPFDSQGKWLTNYDSSGTYYVQVTASDRIDTVSQTVKVTVNNTNRAPNCTLTLGKYTLEPNEVFSVSLFAADPDNQALTFTITKALNPLASGSISNNTYTTSTSFADEGFYTLSATVTDPQGLQATAAKSVQVTTRKKATPIMGDFNGDALTDLGTYDWETGNWEICLSHSGQFESSSCWLSNFGASRDWSPIGGDFNGDGKSDVGIYNHATGELKVALSTGSSFTDSGQWIKVDFASYSWQFFSGNFNADKYTDFGLYNRDTAEVRVFLGTGAGFAPYTTWLASGFGAGLIAFSGDFNGDSLSDLCLFDKESGEFKVAFSNTNAFVDGSRWLSGFANNKDALISDFNNDGMTDVGYWDKDSHDWYYAISTGVSFENKGTWLSGFGSSSDDSASTADFDANGITDAAVFDADGLGIARWLTRLSTNKPADLLTELDNSIGGKTSIAYTYAATNANELPFPVYVAESVTLTDTLPAGEPQEPYSQAFSYSGGYFDFTEREFRGFRTCRVTDPVSGNYTETYFFQGRAGENGALKGQIEKTLAYDANNRLISQTLNTFEVRNAGPPERFLGFPALITQTSTVWEENNSSLSTKNTLTYDNIGNVTQEKNEGDLAKAGDEKSTATSFTPAYEEGFNRPELTSLLDKDGQVVTKKNFAYDEKGNLASETVYAFSSLSPDPRPLTTTYSYDSFGNLTTTTNALGRSVTTEYESNFYAYPEKITNALGQSITYIYEPKFGQVKSVTDTNNSTSTTEYDSLGRVLLVKNGLNQVTTTYAYPDFNTKTTTNALGLFKTEYIDGIGRKYKTVSSAEDGASSRLVSSEVYFNNRGFTDKESLSHYIDESPSQISYIRYEYDLRGRVVKTITDFPGEALDAQSSVSYLEPLYTEATDPKGHRKASRKDAWGNVIAINEFSAGEAGDASFTTYKYDIQNNLLETCDRKGNKTTITYDSLGRKIAMNDPDMGVWRYEYDALGNLLKQTDAKGQVISFEYDALNRLTKKWGLPPQGTVPIVLATYLYDDQSKPYCTGRLSKVIDSSGSTEFFYDKLGREIKSIKSLRGAAVGGDEAIPYTVERAYDILDRLTQLTYPDGEEVTYSYDTNSGLLERVSSLRAAAGGEAISYVKDITYNAKGQINVIKYGNNVQTDYTYAADLRLSRILTLSPVPGSLSPVLQDLNYSFDKNGNVTALTDNLRSNTRTYTYDDLDRLIEAHNLPSASGSYTDYSYEYDSIGNMLYKSDLGRMTYGQNAGPHALTSAGGYTYRYDANGNMTQGKNKTLSYDIENRLISVNEGGTLTNFTYDGDGGRVRKSSLRGAAAGGDEAISTVYIGSLFETDSDGTLRKHIFAGANRVATVSLRGAAAGGDEAISYYHSDHLGSSNVITDKTGALAQRIEYSPYGAIASTDPCPLNPVSRYLFTGKELDSTGLYYYGARYYDPEIGRFITADTIVQAPYDPQSLNRYSYCRNNPINYTDPSGNIFIFDDIIIAIIVGACIGGVIGGISAAVTGGNIWMGILTGALGGALVGGGAAAAYGMWGAAWAWVGAAAGGALSGAANAAISGNNIGIGALVGAIGSGIGFGIGHGASLSYGEFLGGFIGSLAGGAIAGGVGAELSGGSFAEGAWIGAASAAAAYLISRAISTVFVNEGNDLQGVLTVGNKADTVVTEYSRPLNNWMAKFLGLPRHKFVTYNNGNNLFEINNEPGKGGSFIKVNNLEGREVNNYLNKWSGQLKSRQVMVNNKSFQQRMSTYTAKYSGQPYNSTKNNSNYAINYVIYGRGKNVPGGMGWCPPFADE